MERVIYHIPYKLNREHPSGSQIRPLKLLKAFENLNYKVDFIEGLASERREKIRRIKKNVKSGIKYKFLYAESSTEPTLLTEPHHLPTHPFLDHSFFSFCKRHDIRIGLFYRDIFWNFPFYGKGLATWKIYIARLFYKLDLFLYRRFLNVLFLPSVKMEKHIPMKFNIPVIDLPPAALYRNEIKKTDNYPKDFEKINIFYVGGISDLYRMHLLFECINELNNVYLTVCCRISDWNNAKNEYQELLSDKIQIIHEKEENLEEYFNKAHLLSLFIEDHKYWEFVMPLKLFEYIKHQKPVLAVKSTAVGEFVEKNEIGWAINYKKQELKSTLESIREDQKAYSKYFMNFASIITDNSWESRIEKIDKILGSKAV